MLHSLHSHKQHSTNTRLNRTRSLFLFCIWADSLVHFAIWISYFQHLQTIRQTRTKTFVWNAKKETEKSGILCDWLKALCGEFYFLLPLLFCNFTEKASRMIWERHSGHARCYLSINWLSGISKASMRWHVCRATWQCSVRNRFAIRSCKMPANRPFSRILFLFLSVSFARSFSLAVFIFEAIK